jgi:hypothetical protein
MNAELHPKVQWCRRKIRFIELNKITTEEFSYNFLIFLVDDVSSRPYWNQIVHSLPEWLAEPLYTYAKSFLEPLDFMPPPGPFLIGPYDDAEVEAKKKELRPRFLTLFQVIKEWHDSVMLKK